MVFRPGYVVAALGILMLEVAIALHVHDRLIRPYAGDSLAVLLVYAALRGLTPLSVLVTAATAFAIACAIEFGQALHLLDALGLAHNPIARIVLGTGFDPRDFLAYAAGALVALAVEVTLTRTRH